jgi:hypothetical protein
MIISGGRKVLCDEFPMLHLDGRWNFDKNSVADWLSVRLERREVRYHFSNVKEMKRLTYTIDLLEVVALSS